jgi:hypothetical protein
MKHSKLYYRFIIYAFILLVTALLLFAMCYPAMSGVMSVLSFTFGYGATMLPDHEKYIDTNN